MLGTSRKPRFALINDPAIQNTNHIRVSASDTVASSYFFYQQPQYPRDCYEIFNQCSEDRSSGVYLIKPDGYSNGFEVYCDNENDGGGWTTFHRRTEGAIGFDRAWKEYKNGFGFLSNEFWLGLQKLSFLTNQKKYEIRIDLKNRDGLYFSIQYNFFRISDEWSDCRLTGLGDYNKTAEYGYRIGYTVEITFFKAKLFRRKNGQTQMNTLCTRRCECQSNVLTCEDNYRCSSHATCEERGGVRQCYCNDGYTGNGQTCEVVATDCADIYNGGHNAMSWHKNKPFSTYDRDNDVWNDYNCAQRHRGALWYGYYYFYSSYSYCRTSEYYCDYWPEGNGCGACDNSNLNGDYGIATRGNSIHWTNLSGYECIIIYTEMKIKPV
ncbi:Fibrinogen-like protein A [Holothuria leucospilota]|uniref:Fibrinogen-like protein A n=1 Tax=Holothuria leucospilota TaxID=206669 RepID=A0A9Q1H603_HOLLE|nr:Fibrinogen-like protein A [Holothuria leucospilota]